MIANESIPLISVTRVESSNPITTANLYQSMGADNLVWSDNPECYKGEEAG